MWVLTEMEVIKEFEWTNNEHHWPPNGIWQLRDGVSKGQNSLPLIRIYWTPGEEFCTTKSYTNICELVLAEIPALNIMA